MPLTSSLPSPDDDLTVSVLIPRKLSFWPLHLAGWGLFSLVPIAILLTGSVQEPLILALALARPVTGFLLTIAIRPLCRNLQRRVPGHPIAFVCSVGAGSLSLAWLELVASEWILRMCGVGGATDYSPTHFAGLFLLRALVLGVWILLYFGIKLSQRAAAMAGNRRNAELHRLRSQIHPHFLFNSLNSIIAEARDPAKVREITMALSESLRFSLTERGSFCLLSQELAAIENYLHLEKIRFEEKLEYAVDCDASVSGCSLPPFSLLTLVENAVKYGQRTSPLPLRVFVAASLRRGRLHLVVKNTGAWVPPDSAGSLGTGLVDLRRRMDLLYFGAATFSIDATDEGVVASLLLPLNP
jgi:hypothetical protein